MRDMAIRQDHAIVTYPGRPSIARPAVYRDKFPDGSIVANLHRCLFTVELKVLRVSRNDRTREDPAISADPGAFHNGNIAADPGSCTDLNVFVNHCEGVHLYIGGEPGFRVDGREGVDHSAVNWLIFSFLDHY